MRIEAITSHVNRDLPMADTRRGISWSLERKCIFRTGERWFLPGTTFQQLADLRTVAEAEADRRIVDGICVTGLTWGQDGSGESHDVPESGFKIADRLTSYGSFEAALAICRACEANVAGGAETKVAGCYGWLEISADSAELEEQLWKIIEERGLEDRFRALFHVTTPLVYGLWIESPLQRMQASLLYELIEPICDFNDPQDQDVVHFLSALKAAASRELPLHVSMPPPGHTDFGFYTVFPHCPRCKAEAPVGRWKEKYSDEPLECRVCGHTFNPNEHHSSQEDGCDWEATCLEDQLGKAGHEDLITHFLINRGCSVQQAAEVIDNMNHGPLLRRIAEVRKKRDATIRKLRTKRASKPPSELPPSITLVLTDDVVLDLVLVPAGQFMMGSPPTNERNDEGPQHVVQFERPFYIGRFPVTQAQWEAVMGKNPSRFKGDPDLPVDQVSWFDCQEFCDLLGKRQKRVIRLPSEAEWEYACRAGTSTAFAFGDTLLPEQANFTPFSAHPLLGGTETVGEKSDGAAEASGRHSMRPTPVGSYPPNAWGLYDMHGNIEEWCEDVWHYNYDGAPADGTAWLDGEQETPFRVVRGGWCSAAEGPCMSAARRQLRADAGATAEDGADDEEEDEFLAGMLDMAFTPYGFRVVCEVYSS